jgi:alcohol/geraniol dehydrogenase (NADP+)
MRRQADGPSWSDRRWRSRPHGARFLNKWGCEVTAFTSSNSNREEALKLGAHKVVNTRDKEQLKKIAGSLDFILSTVNAMLDWQGYVEALAPKGRFVTVGILTEPI